MLHEDGYESAAKQGTWLRNCFLKSLWPMDAIVTVSVGYCYIVVSKAT